MRKCFSMVQSWLNYVYRTGERKAQADLIRSSYDLMGYQKNGCFFGACIGLDGNRIAGARFMLDGKRSDP